MNEFLKELALVVEGFPPALITLMAPLFGSLATAIVVALASTRMAATPKQLLGQFVVGWLAGSFAGPFFAPLFNLPKYTIGFIAGGSGYWFMSRKIQQMQKEMEKNTGNKPTENGETTPPTT